MIKVSLALTYFARSRLSARAKCYVTSVLSNSLWPNGLVTHQALLSMGFSRQEYQSGLQCPPPGDLPDPGIEPLSLFFFFFLNLCLLSLLHWYTGSLLLVQTGKPFCEVRHAKFSIYLPTNVFFFFFLKMSFLQIPRKMLTICDDKS